MPKKTKREKILAQQRRLRSTPVVTNPILPHEESKAHRITFSLSPHNTQPPSLSHTDIASYKLIKGDIIKTVLLTTFILISEILLSRLLSN